METKTARVREMPLGRKGGAGRERAGGAGMTPGVASGGRLRGAVRRLSAPLRRRLTRWRLLIAGAALLAVLLWSGVAVSSVTTYESTVLFTEGGGIGLPPPLETLDFGDVPRGMPMHRNVVLQNSGKFDTYVLVFTWGGIRDFLSVDDAFFNMEPGEEHNIDFNVQAPTNANPKRYSGRVFVVRLPWWWPF